MDKFFLVPTYLILLLDLTLSIAGLANETFTIELVHFALNLGIRSTEFVLTFLAIAINALQYFLYFEVDVFSRSSGRSCGLC